MPKRVLAGCLLGLLAPAFAWAAPAENAVPAAISTPLPQDGYFEVSQKVAPGVWVIREAESFHLQPIGNVTVIEQADGLVLVDSGGSPGSGRRIAALIRKLSPKPVKAAIITDWHGDRSLGFSAIRAAWPKAQEIATAPTAEHMTGESMSAYPKDAPDPAKTEAFLKRLQPVADSFAKAAQDPKLTEAEREGFRRTLRELQQYRADCRDLYIVTPDRTFTDHLSLPDPVRPVEVIQPGRANTDGDAAAWLPRQRVLVSGDIVVAPVPFGFGSYPADWVAALKRLSAYPFAVLVPGHGAPQTSRAYLERMVGLIEDVRAQTAPLAAQGLSLEEVQKKVDLERQTTLFAGDDPWLRRWFKSYWITPFVEVAWKEAKGIPIVQGRG